MATSKTILSALVAAGVLVSLALSQTTEPSEGRVTINADAAPDLFAEAFTQTDIHAKETTPAAEETADANTKSDNPVESWQTLSRSEKRGGSPIGLTSYNDSIRNPV